MIPFLDVGASYRELQVEIDAAVKRVLESGSYILGTEVEAFEAEWAAYCGAEHAVGVANGLDALTLALMALDVGPGDEVIVPSNTYIATWLAVTRVGARPVPVEPDPRTFTIDTNRIAEAITPATRVLLPVHLYGRPADIDPVSALARKYGLSVVEDAAQAHGAAYKGRRIGGHGDIVCWSFFPGKNLGALGDAGGITTDRADIADRIRVLRNYGSRKKYLNEVTGVNSRLDPLQAAVLRAKLPHLDEWTNRRRATATSYLEGIGCEILMPCLSGDIEQVWHLFVIRSKRRDWLQEQLTRAGIGTLVHYPVPPHKQEAYAYLGYGEHDFPIASRLAREVLSLPVGPQQARAATDRVIEVLTGLLHG